MKAIHGYVHHDKSFGILVEFEVGTDFTTRTPEFKTLAEQVAMAFGLNDLPDSKDLPEDTFVPSENSTPEEKLAFRIEFTRMLEDNESIRSVLDRASKTFHEPIRVTRLWDTRDAR